jgi:hypothetical protein
MKFLSVMNKHFSTLWVLGILCLAPFPISATDMNDDTKPKKVVDVPAPLYPLEVERTDTLKQQTLYNYTISKYKEPVKISRFSDTKTPEFYHRAESVAKAHFASMIAGDYPLWLSLWDSAGKKKILRENAKQRRGEQFWQSIWWRTLGDFDTFHMTRRVDSGYYVIIEMLASDSTGQNKAIKVEVPMLAYNTKRGIIYAVTDKLDDDPVFKYWRKKKPTLTRTAR